MANNMDPDQTASFGIMHGSVIRSNSSVYRALFVMHDKVRLT